MKKTAKAVLFLANLLVLLLLFFFAAAFAALAHRFQALLAPFCPIHSALYEFRPDKFQHDLLRSVTLAPSEPDNTGVATVALPESCAQLIEQFLDGGGRGQDGRCLAA